MTPGVYQLHLHLPRSVRLAVGTLPRCVFPAGRYLYTGSALNGLEQRLARHRRRRKRKRWHIDSLLRHARITSVAVFPTSHRLECALNRNALKRPGAHVIVRRFGASDCRCPAHLLYLGRSRRARRPAPRERERTMKNLR